MLPACEVHGFGLPWFWPKKIDLTSGLTFLCPGCHLIYWVGRPLVPKVLKTVFWEFPRSLGCTAAAMLPMQAKGTFRKHVTKPSEQVAALPSNKSYDWDQPPPWGPKIRLHRAGWGFRMLPRKWNNWTMEQWAEQPVHPVQPVIPFPVRHSASPQDVRMKLESASYLGQIPEDQTGLFPKVGFC